MSHWVVAMSGGVDSSVAAALLHESGHRVVGVTLRLLKRETGFGCCGSTRDIEDAKAVCGTLGIPHYVLDFSDTFAKNVMDPFFQTYLDGETPNPCIACNRHVKFDALLSKALALGADGVATGHYARRVKAADGIQLWRAKDHSKDQSYVLHHLGQQELARLAFPVGDLTKEEVRQKAEGWNLRTARKPDSQEICFVPDADTAAYIKNRVAETDPSAATAQPGDIQNTQGVKLGTHRGVAYYTHGQRRGLGLSAGKPLYVVDLNPQTNTLVVGDDLETESDTFLARDVHWTAGHFPEDRPLQIQIRAHHRAVPGHVTRENHLWRVGLDVPQRAVTPGQSAVFYQGEQVLGGGIIVRG